MVDAGNLLLYRKQRRPQAKVTPALESRLRARAELVAQIYVQMGVQAVAVGPLDLGLGLATLKKIARTHRLPLLSANLRDPAGRAVFPANKLITVGGIKIGIFGLTGAQRGYPAFTDAAVVKLEDATKAAQAQVKALRARGAQLVIALAALSNNPARAVALATPGIDFMFVSGTGRHSQKLDRWGGAWSVETAREGKYMGQLTLHVNKGKVRFEDFSERFVLAQRIQQMKKRLDVLERRKQGSAAKGRGDWVERRLQKAKNSIAEMGAKLYKVNRQVPAGSFFANRLEPVSPALPQDPAVKQLVTRVAKEAGLIRPRGAH